MILNAGIIIIIIIIISDRSNNITHSDSSRSNRGSRSNNSVIFIIFFITIRFSAVNGIYIASVVIIRTYLIYYYLWPEASFPIALSVYSLMFKMGIALEGELIHQQTSDKLVQLWKVIVNYQMFSWAIGDGQCSLAALERRIDNYYFHS